MNRISGEKVSLTQMQHNRQEIRGRDIDGGHEVRGVTPIDFTGDNMTRGVLHAS